MEPRSTETASEAYVQRRIGVVDPARQQVGGHHLTSLELLEKALRPEVPAFHVNRASSPDIAQVLSDVRFSFSTDPERPTPQRRKRKSKPRRWQLWQLMRRARGYPPDILDGNCYREDLLEIISGYDSADHLIFPTTKADTLASLISVIRHIGTENIPHLHLRFLEYAPKPDRDLARGSFEQLSGLAASCPQIHLYTETETLRRYLMSRFGFREIGKSILQPTKADPNLRRSYAVENGTISVGYVGGGLRKDKGYQRLPAIFGAALQKLKSAALAERTRFVVQISNDRRGRNLKQRLLAIPGLEPTQLKIVSGDLNLADFSALLASCDMLVFPYSDEKKAQMISSGILIDAVINAVPVICSPIETLTEFVGDDTGAIADSDEEFANAIVRMATDLEIYKKGAARYAESFRDSMSGNDLIKSVIGTIDSDRHIAGRQR
ncbi:MAG: glycosyltransferase [Pseudomonadota bacterium]